MVNGVTPTLSFVLEYNFLKMYLLIFFIFISFYQLAFIIISLFQFFIAGGCFSFERCSSWASCLKYRLKPLFRETFNGDPDLLSLTRCCYVNTTQYNVAWTYMSFLFCFFFQFQYGKNSILWFIQQVPTLFFLVWCIILTEWW